MSAVAVLVLKTQGAGYHAIHLAGRNPKLEILEMIPMADKAQVLIKGPQDDVLALVKSVSISDLDSTTLFPEWNEKVERAFYSLDHATPQGAMVFLEGLSLGLLFQAAHSALAQGYQLVDLKIPRGSVQWGILIVTAPEISEGWVDEFRHKGLQCWSIAEPSNLLKKYFEIEA